MPLDIPPQAEQCCPTCGQMLYGPLSRKIATAVSQLTSVSVVEIMGEGRPDRVATARQLCMWIAVKQFGKSYASAARGFDREQWTARHAVTKIDRLIKASPCWYEIAKQATRIARAQP